MRFAPPVHGAGPGGVAARAPVAGHHPAALPGHHRPPPTTIQPPRQHTAHTPKTRYDARDRTHTALLLCSDSSTTEPRYSSVIGRRSSISSSRAPFSPASTPASITRPWSRWWSASTPTSRRKSSNLARTFKSIWMGALPQPRSSRAYAAVTRAACGERSSSITAPSSSMARSV